MKTAIKLFTNLLKDESGQDLIEYALVAGLVGLGAVTMITGLGTAIGAFFTAVSTKVATLNPS